MYIGNFVEISGYSVPPLHYCQRSKEWPRNIWVPNSLDTEGRRVDKSSLGSRVITNSPVSSARQVGARISMLGSVRESQFADLPGLGRVGMVGVVKNADALEVLRATCAAEAEKKKRAIPNKNGAPEPLDTVTVAAPPPDRSPIAQKICLNCRVRPSSSGYDYCGRNCAVNAASQGNSAPQTADSLKAPHPVAESTPNLYSSSSAPPPTTLRNGSAENVSICAVNANSRRNSAAQATSASRPPNSGAGRNVPPYNSSTGGQAFNAPPASNFCEYVKSQEMGEDGVVTTHPYCGIGCYKASLEQTGFPLSTIPARAAASVSQDALNIRVERLNTPIGRKILKTVQECWKSDKIQSPQVKRIYRIDLPGQVYRRFDLALQMNDVFAVTTTYYGGIATCNIADDTDPSPCASESCELCDALRGSFGNLLYGASCRDGSYGPGLYTYLNPALAYDSTDFDDEPQGQNFALIQCRVVTRADSKPSLNSYAGFIDDSGVVFCAQSTAVIPTHLLTYQVGGPPNPQQPKVPVNTTAAQSGEAVSAQTLSSPRSGQANGFTVGPSMTPAGHASGAPKAESNADLRTSGPTRRELNSCDEDEEDELPEHPPGHMPPKAPVTFADPWDDTPARASAFSPYWGERQSTSHLDPYAASSTAATSGQPVAEPADTFTGSVRVLCFGIDDIQLGKIKGICRLDVPAKIYRRFDTALCLWYLATLAPDPATAALRALVHPN
ncbi:hypothetical protein M407DRAFT_228650 [Tulasnella calospora MUT 4182]|uniref:Uncharacterized protein n=1 Tax=Tulasnella calospora MUT 4182 TaxID=1051891 RepID=A0A0C3Q3S0_9AGAM|nr:hypothetical protein M407DRAFT_228650 [Tulasnella calospora MUT 4182]